MSNVNIIKVNENYYIKSSEPYLISFNNNLVLDAKDGKTSAGTLIWSYEINKTAAQQWYIWQEMNNHHDFILENVKAKRVMNIEKAVKVDKNLMLYNKIENGKSTKYDCKQLKLHNNEIFFVNDNIIVATDNNKIQLTSYGLKEICKTSYNGTKIQFLDFNLKKIDYPGNCDQREQLNSSNDKMRYFSLATGGKYYFRRSKKFYYIRFGDFVFDVSGGKTSSGTKIQLYKINKTAAQQWYIWRDNFGRIVFQNVGSKKMLNIPNAKTDVQVQNHTDLNDKIYTDMIFSLTKRENLYPNEKKISNAYYIQMVDETKNNYVVSGINNISETPVKYCKPTLENYIFISSDGNDIIDFNSIEFENFEQTNVKKKEEVNGTQVEDLPFSNLSLTDNLINEVVKKIVIQSKNNSVKVNLKENYFKTIEENLKTNQKKTLIDKNLNGKKFEFSLQQTNENVLTPLNKVEFNFNSDFTFDWYRFIGTYLSYTGDNLLDYYNYFTKNNLNSQFLFDFGSNNSNFVKLIHSNKTTEIIGWNRYRPEKLSEINNELAYYNRNFNNFVSEVLHKNLYNTQKDLSEHFLKMFIKENKLCPYVLYTGLISELMKFYDFDFMSCIPGVDVNSLPSFPYWQKSSQFFNDEGENISWSIINYEDKNKPNWLKENIFNHIGDYNNVFQVYDQNKNINLELDKNTNDSKLSLDYLKRSHSSIAKLTEENYNYSPFFKTEWEENKYKFDTNTNLTLGKRFKGCVIGDGIRKYLVKIGVTDRIKLKNNGGNLVKCGDTGADGIDPDGDKVSMESSTYIPSKITMKIYEKYPNGKYSGVIDSIDFDTYVLNYIDDYGGVDYDCTKNSKCEKNYWGTKFPSGDAWNCGLLNRNDEKTKELKINFANWFDKKQFTTKINTYQIQNSFIKKLKEYTKSTVDKELFNPNLLNKYGDSRNDAYYKDEWWMKTKDTKNNVYLSLLNKNNHDVEVKDGFYGDVIEIDEAIISGESTLYLGNYLNENQSCPEEYEDFSKAGATSSPLNLESRCYVKNEKTINLFDQRVDLVIIKFLQTYAKILSNDLEYEILKFFKDKSVSLIPIRLLKDYIPKLSFNQNKQPMSNLENLLGPMMIYVKEKILTDHNNYIAGWPDKYKNIKLKCNETIKHNIGSVELQQSDYCIDQIYQGLLKKFGEIEDYNDVAIVLTLNISYSSLHDYIGKNNNNIYQIGVYSTKTSDEIESNKFALINYLNEQSSNKLKLIISLQDLSGRKGYNLIPIEGNIVEPSVRVYKQYFKTNGEEDKEVVNELYSSYKFIYSNQKIYLYKSNSNISFDSSNSIGTTEIGQEIKTKNNLKALSINIGLNSADQTNLIGICSAYQNE